MSLKNEIISRRLCGLSYNEIRSELNCSKGIISYYCSKIELAPELQERLMLRRVENGRRTGLMFGGSTECSEEHRTKAVSNGKSVFIRHKETILANLKKGRETEASHFAYRKDEIPTKQCLELKYGVVFRKEKISGIFFDFCSEHYIIEHSIDPTKGLSAIITRFQMIEFDGRTRIAYINNSKLGRKRLSRLVKVVDEILSVEDLNGV